MKINVHFKHWFWKIKQKESWKATFLLKFVMFISIAYLNWNVEINKDIMSIGAKVLTNKERDEQTKIQSDKQINMRCIMSWRIWIKDIILIQASFWIFSYSRLDTGIILYFILFQAGYRHHSGHPVPNFFFLLSKISFNKPYMKLIFGCH